ncbi:IGF-like family receptor 1 [Cheilinus undulatus]|uniref:IGF-like family receptor 1 n=1 Tax=Cheilinus undulatus TaxID=241271 RepID=UPI001BD30A6E|nr:IGF-like family receptor 1 [Cheilinus undulatus]
MKGSTKCPDPKTRWNRRTSKCEQCPLKPGHEVTPHCGFDDNGGRHFGPHKPCKPGTFNDGSSAYCNPCASCKLGFRIVQPCNTTVDTKCEETRNETTDVPDKGDEPSQIHPTFFSNGTTKNGFTSSPHAVTTAQVLFDGHALPSHVTPWSVPLAIVLPLITLVLFAACVFYMKQKKGQNTAMSYSRRSPYINAGFSPLSASSAKTDLDEVLSPDILSAPLQAVLDNLDVLEELVILLDPESHGVKNTKHLASHCSFSATWITYTYSMKDSKSPLKAVLEGLTSKHPDWTVGHLAKLLRHMERNDAIAVLAKIQLNEVIM